MSKTVLDKIEVTFDLSIQTTEEYIFLAHIHYYTIYRNQCRPTVFRKTFSWLLSFCIESTNKILNLDFVFIK